MEYNLFIHIATDSGNSPGASINRSRFITDGYACIPINGPGTTTWVRVGDNKTYLCLTESYGTLEKAYNLSKEIGNIILENNASISFQELNQQLYDARDLYSSTSALSRIDFQSDQVVIQNIGNLPVLIVRDGNAEKIYEEQTVEQINRKQRILCDSLTASQKKRPAYLLNTNDDISKWVSHKKNTIQDGDIYVICTANVLEALTCDNIANIASFDSSLNKAHKILRATREKNKTIGTISVAVITIKQNRDWENDPKIKNQTGESLKELAKHFDISKRGKFAHDLLEKKVPETRESLLQQALYYELTIDEIDYYLEEYGFARLYPKNPDDFTVMYILKKNLAGKYAVRLFKFLTSYIKDETKKNTQSHDRVDTETVGVLIARENKHDGRLNTESMYKIVDDFKLKYQCSPAIKNAFSERYMFLQYYLNVIIATFGQLKLRENIFDEDFVHDKISFTSFLKKSGINNIYCINRLLNKKNQFFSTAFQGVPEREFFLFIGLLCRLSEEEFDFLLETSDMRILNNYSYDKFITVPLKKLAQHFPLFFNTYDDTIERSNEVVFRTENDWKCLLEESGLQFAVSICNGKPKFLYRNFAEFICIYWAQQSNELYENFISTKLYKDYLSQLDIAYNFIK